MNTDNKQKRHLFLDHPILSGSVLLAVYILICKTVSFCISPFFANQEFSEAVYCLIPVLSALALSLLVKMAVKNGYILGLRAQNFGECLKLGWLFPAYLIVQGIFNSLDSPWYANVTLTVILTAFFQSAEAGFSEELMFRSLIANNMMRVWIHKKYGIYASAVISALIFGGIHLMNASVVGFTLALFSQLIYSPALGILLGAMYLRTRNLWGCIVMHTMLDFFNMLYVTGTTEDILREQISMEDMLVTGLLVVFSLAAAFYMLRPAKHEQIRATWMTAEPGPAKTVSAKAEPKAA